MSNKTYRIAIVGASSLLGKELSDALSESPLGASSFTLLDEEQLAGNMAAAGDEISFIQKIDATSFEGKDLVFFAGERGGDAEALAERAEGGGEHRGSDGRGGTAAGRAGAGAVGGRGVLRRSRAG